MPDLMDLLAQSLGLGNVSGTVDGVPTVPSVDPRQAAMITALSGRTDPKQLSLTPELIQQVLKERSKPTDYAGRYNTKLSPGEESSFQDWLKTNSKTVGKDLSRDLSDYDLRGQFKETQGAPVEPGHGTDKWKKPNHPTFSNESVYHGKEGLEGGTWGNGTFTPGKTNLQQWSVPELQNYFKTIEPDVNLVLPQSDLSTLQQTQKMQALGGTR